jgi:hypothetical protein
MTTGTIPHLTLSLANELIERAIAEKGEDYVYLNPEGNRDNCYNWHLQPDGQVVPGCIVGHVWHYLGFQPDEVNAGAGVSAVVGELVISGRLNCERDALQFLWRMQVHQDLGIPWGVAYKLVLAEQNA